MRFLETLSAVVSNAAYSCISNTVCGVHSANILACDVKDKMIKNRSNKSIIDTSYIQKFSSMNNKTGANTNKEVNCENISKENPAVNVETKKEEKAAEKKVIIDVEDEEPLIYGPDFSNAENVEILGTIIPPIVETERDELKIVTQEDLDSIGIAKPPKAEKSKK